ncbi:MULTISPECIES: YdcF family protein [Aphanothece]|uniref:YdcF family protein n=1 Tax=Aphanothece TaxID=1121 RepID=UPI003984E038
MQAPPHRHRRSPAASRLAPVPQRRRRGPRRRRRRAGWRRWVLLLLLGSLIWLSRGWWWPSPPPPQMILVLGGDLDRERHAARIAKQLGLPVVVSGGSNPEYAHWLFEQRQGLPPGQVQLDYRANDTLSNFTSLVDDLRRARIRHALLVTSSDHMDRALLVGRIVAGSRGIHLTPEPVGCGALCQPESRRKVWGDGLRAALWVLSGRDLKRWAAERLSLLPVAARQGGSAPDPAGR